MSENRVRCNRCDRVLPQGTVYCEKCNSTRDMKPKVIRGDRRRY